MSKEIEIAFNDDGTMDVDQIGFKGSACSGNINDLLKALGKVENVKKKPEFYATNDVNVRQNN
jgi:hypothetical protein